MKNLKKKTVPVAKVKTVRRAKTTVELAKGNPEILAKSENKKDWIEVDSSGSLVLVALESDVGKDKKQSGEGSKKFVFGVHVMDFIASVFWVYVFLQIFVFDLPRMVMSFFFPAHQYLADYKSIVFLIVFLVQAYLWKRTEIVLFYLYLVFFPILVLVWKIPKYLVFAQDWRLPFALFTTSLRFFQSFKIHLLLSTAWLIAVIICYSFQKPVMLWMAVCILIGTTCANYLMRIASVFHGDQITAKTKFVVEKIGKLLRDKKSVQERNRMVQNPADEDAINLWRNDLDVTLLFNRSVLHIAQQFRDYQTSGVAEVGAVFAIIKMFFGTVLTFTFVNFAIFKVDTLSFAGKPMPDFFDFFYYSFNTMMFNAIEQVRPMSNAAQIIAMFENFVAFVLVAILIGLIFSVRAQRLALETEKVIAVLEEQARSTDKFIEEHFSLSSLSDVVAELNKMQNSLTKVILALLGRRKAENQSDST